MKIKQVEELVGITRKNIRFYEDQGLLNVERAENGYREYHQADVIRLQEIKLFRKMDISIEEMKLLFEKKKSLQICLEQHLKELTLLMLLTIIIIFWANIQDPIPTGLFLLLEGIPIVIIVGTLIALAGRMKEIEGGEEDEASKY